MSEPIVSVLLVIDRAVQDDLLLWPAVARAVARARPSRLVVLHAAGETAERALEAGGFESSLASAPPAAWPTLRRALIEENRKAAAVLTEEGVSAVPLLGSSRDLLSRSEAPWFTATVRAGAVPVISAVHQRGEQPIEAVLDDALLGVARLLEGPVRIVRLGPEEIPSEVIEDGITGCGAVIYRLEQALLAPD